MLATKAPKTSTSQRVLRSLKRERDVLAQEVEEAHERWNLARRAAARGAISMASARRERAILNSLSDRLEALEAQIEKEQNQ